MKAFSTVLLTLLLPLIIACGFTGGTRVLLVKPDKTNTPLSKNVTLNSFHVEDNAIFRYTPGRPLSTTGLGAFDEDDKENFEASLKKSLTILNVNSNPGKNDALMLKVLLRRNVLAAGSVSIVNFGIYRYALFDSRNNKVYEEQFYVTHSNLENRLETIGRIKDGLHRKALRRIVSHSAAFASNRDPSTLEPIEGTFKTMEQVLPELVSTFVLLPVVTYRTSANPVPGLTLPSGTAIKGGEEGRLTWKQFDRIETVNW
ncbi:hypothetical protein [Kangiella sediminilitoris]|uniref:Lipoprotein n=1 Tax=Kangiella sediminilitoris TaxID=1144748 RepID=A0A1B3B7M8_9GAMM|nr:hypothetical protein [Kangiella sediminilitoris]AOE48794.1 hypothetical protein KS2013_62 [Kangiella sediminilitoris]